MAIANPTRYKKFAIQLFVIQLLVVIAALLLGSVLSPENAFSIFCGGLIYIIPNGLFVSVYFKPKGASAVNSMAKAFYRAEFIKYFVTVLLLITFISLFPINIKVTIISFILFQPIAWIAPLFIANRKRRFA